MSLPSSPVILPTVFSRKALFQPVAGVKKRLVFLEKHPADNDLLEGGRNLLLESAQEATLTSVAIPAFKRQCNCMVIPLLIPHCKRTFTFPAGH
jgi:hypothetical protein